MKKIGIIWLPHRRDDRYAKIITHFLGRIRHKDEICVNIFCRDTESTRWTLVANELTILGIESHVHCVLDHQPNYMQKIESAIALGHEYCIKMDEDVFMSEHVWDFLIENVGWLDDPDHLTLAPELSNGIPTYDYFASEFLTRAEHKHIHDALRTVKYGNTWGYDYSSLNKHTVDLDAGHHLVFPAFWVDVEKIDTPFMGVHPIRFSVEAQIRLNKIIAQRLDQFFTPDNMKVSGFSPTYFCNSLFAIRSDDWKQLLTDGTERHGPFDEVALNLYRKKHDMQMGFICRGWAAHTAYGPNQYSEKMVSAENGFVDTVVRFIDGIL